MFESRTEVPLIQLDGVSIQLNGNLILNSITFKIARGESVAILGPNGAGKTTLIKAMAREVRPLGGVGRVVIDGDASSSVQDIRKILPVVSPDQPTKLIHDPTVLHLAVSGAYGTYGIVPKEGPSDEIKSRAMARLTELGVAHLSSRLLSTVSTGEGRRAWIARALVTSPLGLILDEPTANLDRQGSRELLKLLRSLANGGLSLILVTHTPDDVLPQIQRVLLMRDGAILKDGPSSELLAAEALDAAFSSREKKPTKSPVTPEEYLAAIVNSPVYDVAIKSPLEYAPMLSQIVKNNVWLKREDKQPTFSFKIRGAYCHMAGLTQVELMKGVIAASAGNHAQGVALTARRLGTKATIVVPRTTPQVKVDAIRALGAELIVVGDNYDAAHATAKIICEERDLTYVHPYDQPEVIAGQGTIGLEIIDQFPGIIDAVFVAVGGGGLISGIALAVKQLSPTTLVIGVEPVDSDAMHRSLACNERLILDTVGLLADGVAVRQVGEETFRITKEWVDEVITVSNDAICGAVKEIFEDRRAVLEPSGALAFAGLKEYASQRGLIGKTLVAIACGANLSFDRLRYIAERATVGEQREAILAVTIPERRGSFRKFCNTLGERAITEFNYRFGDSEKAVVFVGLSVADREGAHLAVAALTASGYPTLDLTADEIATMHLRHMVGGRSPTPVAERYFHVDFPERAGALGQFLAALGDRYNISMFHYRNHGSDVGRVLVGLQVGDSDDGEFEKVVGDLQYPMREVTENSGLRLFLG